MNFKIDSCYFNEHTNELVLYVGDAIFCTISNVKESEIEGIISDVEWEENRYKSKEWAEYLAK